MTRSKTQKPTVLVKIGEDQNRFLAAYQQPGATVSGAARIAKVDRQQHYEWLSWDEGYRKKFQAAKAVRAELHEEGLRELLDAARAKALTAIPKVPFATAGELRKWIDDVIKNGRLLAGQSTENVAQKVDLTTTTYTDEEVDAACALLEGEGE